MRRWIWDTLKLLLLVLSCDRTCSGKPDDKSQATVTDVVPALRIIGGVQVPVAVPWMVSLQARPSALYYFGHICGGSLVDNNHVLTAAHCILNDDIGVSRALSGNFRLAIGGASQAETMVDGPGFSYRFVQSIYCHPGFTEELKENDICILRFNESVPQQPIRLNVASSVQNIDKLQQYEAPGTFLSLYGWGLTNASDENSVSDVLRVVQVPIIPRSACVPIYGPHVMTMNQICAGYLTTGGKDACQGDSGGPAVSEDGFQVGITSYGAGCAEPLMPGAYTRISSYGVFIENALSGKIPETREPSSATAQQVETVASAASMPSVTSGCVLWVFALTIALLSHFVQ